MGFKRTLIIVTVVTVYVFASGLIGTVAQDTEAFVEVTCGAGGGCHSDNHIENIKVRPYSVEEWRDVVDRMERHGADVSSGEKETIVQFLAGEAAEVEEVEQEEEAEVPVEEVSAEVEETEDELPEEQAYTGAEIWVYLLVGGSMAGSGLALRRHSA